MQTNSESSLILIAILAVVGFIVLIIDAVIFFRWLRYAWAKYDLEEKQALERREAAQRADISEQADGEHAVEMPEPLDLPAYPFARTWSLVDPFLAFQAVFIVGNIVVGLALLPVLFWHGKMRGVDSLFSGPGIILQTIGLFFLNGLFVGVTAFYVHRYRSTLADIGLRRPSSRQLAMGFGLGLLLFAIASGAEIGIGNVLPHLLPKAVMDGLTQFTKDVTAGGMFAKIPSLQLKIFFALAGAVAAPIGEEVFFRGFLYNALKRRLNVTAAIVISGLTFALVHFGPLAILVIFPMGMILAYVYEKTRSLWVTICMHATNNGMAFILALTIPGFGETPDKPVQPVAPPAKPAIVCPVPPCLAPHDYLSLIGARAHGQA